MRFFARNPAKFCIMSMEVEVIKKGWELLIMKRRQNMNVNDRYEQEHLTQKIRTKAWTRIPKMHMKHISDSERKYEWNIVVNF